MIGYMCTTDFEYHLDHDVLGTKIYPTLEALKQNTTCWEECGITEVKIEFTKCILESKI